MPIRKIAEIKLKAGPYGRLEAVGSGFKFYSYDKDSAAIDFYFREQNGSPTDILGCTTELVLLTKEDGQQKKLTIIDSEVEIISALKGHARYVIPDRLRGYVGLVQGYVYLNFPDESRTDECRFDFTIERSLIEEEFENGGDYYIKDIQVIFDEVKDTLNSKIPEMQTKYDDLVKTFTDYANEKIAEYDSRFVTLNSNLLTLQDSLTTAKTKVTQLERSINTANNNLNARIDEISKKIDDNDVYTKAETEANVVYQIIGKEKVRMEFTLDFDKKIISSNVENPNWSGAAYGGNQLPGRSDFKNILSPQSRMDSLKSLDGNNVTVVTVAGSPQYPCVGIKWDVVETLTRFLGESFFADRGAVDVASKANVAKQIINNALSSNIWGYGTSPNGNDFNIANLVTGTGWQFGSVPPNNSNVVKKLRAINSSDATIQTDGNIYTIAYSSQSTADKQSSIYVDYATLTFSIEVSMNEHIKSMIATYSGENINKNFVGLGNVDNYSTATQAEAEAGTDNAKTMTPLRTSQQIDKKSVTLASNQTIGGIKNFRDDLLKNGVSVSAITKNVIYEADGIGSYFNPSDKFTLGASGKIDKIVLVWSRVDDAASTLLNYSWVQTVLSPDDLIFGNSYRIQLTTDNYKFVSFANENGNVTISGASENNVTPNKIYRIKRIVAYIKK